MANICAHVYVAGYVQGVAYRYSAIRAAKRLGLTGWVRNLRDGRVEALIEGEEAQVRQMVAWCQEGPPSAAVSEVTEEYQPYTGKFHSFDVVF